MKNLQGLGLVLDTVAAGLYSPSNSVGGSLAAAASPAAAQQIGDYFKNLAAENPNGKLNSEQQTAHILAHGILAAATAAAGGNDALSAGIAAGTAEAAAPKVAKWLYGTDDSNKLSAEQKATVSSITGLGGAAVGAATGSNTATDAVSGSRVAQNAVENNALETVWDVANVGIGVASFTYNVNEGNYWSAAIDAAGLVYDGGATAVPFVPAGASAGLQAYRAGNSVKQSVIIGKDVAQASKAANQAARDLNNITRNPATTGTKIHRNTGVLLGEANGKASKLSNSTSSYFKGANKSTGLQPDMSWKGTGVWSDLTTQGQWNSHVTKYNKQFGTTGIRIIYVPRKGVTNTLKLNSGAGVTINGLRQLGNTSEKEK